MAILTQYTDQIIHITESLQVPGTCKVPITKRFNFIFNTILSDKTRISSNNIYKNQIIVNIA